MQRLKKRRDFLKVQKGRRVHTGLFSVQALGSQQESATRIGFTVSKKVSLSAVKRNRIRRRLKEAARLVASGAPACGMDYVVVGRIAALHAPFSRITSELSRSLRLAAIASPVDPSARNAIRAH